MRIDCMEDLFYPLHPAQLDVFLDQLIDPDSPHYNTGGYIVLKGTLDKEKFMAVVRSVPVVFDAFRMRFDMHSDEPGFYLDTAYNCFEISEVDFSKEADPAAAAAKWVQDDFNIAFPIVKDALLFKQALLKIADDEYWSFNKYHHLITDGYGFAVWAQFVAGNYLALISGVDPSFVYPSYVQQSLTAAAYYKSQDYRKEMSYWEEKLSIVPPKPFTASVQYAQKADIKSGKYRLCLTPRQRLLLEELQTATKCSLQQLTIAAFTIYLGKTTSQREFIFGIPIHRRRNREQRLTFGMFSGILPFKAAYEKSIVLHDLLKTVRQAQKNDYRNQHYQIGDLYRNAHKYVNVDSPFDVLINYENLNFSLDFGGELTAHTYHVLSEYEKRPFHLCWRDFGNQQPLELHIDFLYTYFSDRDVEAIASRLLMILENMTGSLNVPVASLSLVTESERRLLLSGFNKPAVDYNLMYSIPDLFGMQAKRTPGNLAVVDEKGQITYEKLNRLSNRLCHCLYGRGIRANDIISIFLEPGINMIAAILGTLKAGAAYLPVDLKYPQERIHYMIQHSGSKLIICSESSRTLLGSIAGVDMLCIDEIEWHSFSEERLRVSISMQQLFYLIYTSGSTGNPKGAGVYHYSVVNLFYWYVQEFAIGEHDRNMIISSVGFDLTQKNIFSTLCTGGMLVMPLMDQFDVSKLVGLVAAHSVTIINCTPSAFYPFAEDSFFYDSIETLRLVVLGGEPIHTAQLSRWLSAKKTTCEIVNSYGPTECTDIAAFYRIDNLAAFVDKPMPIGIPNTNVQIFVLNQDNELLPVDMVGQICISGAGVGPGYLNDKELTGMKFIPNPFGSGRLYFTGDTGRWLPDGNLLCLGRMDDQVKIRGYRVEPGEIENVILQSGLVSMVAVLAREIDMGEKRLLAFVVPENSFDHTHIHNFLQQRLPAHMLPSRYIELDRFPLSANGKVDRKALSVIEIPVILENTSFLPASEIESVLSDMWKQVLSVTQVDISHSFFELGGNSLVATRLLNRIRKFLGVSLDMQSLFAHPTIRQLAIFLQSLKDTANIAGITHTGHLPFPPLSFAQERLYFIDQYEGSQHYHLPLIFSVTGNLDMPALDGAFRLILDRHQVCKTVFKQNGDGELYQHILSSDDWQMVVEYPGNKTIERDHDEWIKAFIDDPFDLTADYMLRVKVICIHSTLYTLLIKIHHIAADGWSVPIFLRDLTEGYDALLHNRKPEFPALALKYTDYAYWQRNFLQGKVLDDKIDFWKAKLNGSTPFNLSADSGSAFSAGSKHGKTFSFEISNLLALKIKRFCIEQGATMFMTFISAFNVLLHRYSGQQDICIGYPVANRTSQGIDGLVGFFVNILPLRLRIGDDMSFAELMRQVRNEILEAYAFQDAPLEKMEGAIGNNRFLGKAQPFDVVFVFQHREENPDVYVELSGLKMSRRPVSAVTAKFNLTFSVEETEDGLEGKAEYCTDLYKEETIHRIVQHYLILLEALTSDPVAAIGKWPMITEIEKYLFRSFNDTKAFYPSDKTIIHLFEIQVAKTPDHIALVSGDIALTYQMLNGQANQVGRYLRDYYDVRPNEIIGVGISGQDWTLIAVLGILKSGAAFLPLDADMPVERFEHMYRDCSCRLVINPDEWSRFLVVADNFSKENFEQSGVANDLAYVIYTSGSTGLPKGVMIENKGLVNLCCWHVSHFAVTAMDKASLYANMMFDASVWEFFPYIISGAAVYVVPSAIRLSVEALSSFYTQHEITISFLPTPVGEQFLKEQNSSLRYLLIGGDKLNAFENTSYQVVNNYGPTEGTVVATSFPVEQSDANIPIGKPISNTRLYILNSYFELCPLGVPGELYIAGDGLARGYINREDLSKERFLHDLCGEARLYKTGDICRWLPSGNVEFIGRADDQLKIRGYRIELGEVEAVLNSFPTIISAVVTVRKSDQGENQLVAYFISREQILPQVIRSFLAKKLPAYMLPGYYVRVYNWTLTSNGKIDRKCLPPIDPALNTSTVEYAAPENDVEQKLVSIWQKILGILQIGVLDDFFELGGHSMLATKMVWAIRKELDAEVTIRDLFLYPTIREIASRLRREDAIIKTPGIIPQKRNGSVPLSFAQERLWIIDQLKGSVQYHIPAVLRLHGRLQPEALVYAFNCVIDRHEILRTVIKATGGIPYQETLEPGTWQLEFTDKAVFDGDENGISEAEYINEMTERIFDLSCNHMLRAGLVRLHEDEYLLVIVLHHISSDAWSLPIIIKELSGFYRAAITNVPYTVPVLPIQYADYAIWQRNYLSGFILDGQLSYWIEHLKDVTPVNLPHDFARPAMLSHQGAVVEATISEQLKRSLQQLSRGSGVSLFITMLAAFKVLLSRYSGQTDICIGSPTADRTHDAVDGLVGFFVNTVVVRTDLQHVHTFQDVLKEVKKSTLDAYQYQDVPFEKIVQAVVKERDLSRTPIFQIMFALQNTDSVVVDDDFLHGLKTSHEPHPSATTIFEINFAIQETANGLSIQAGYSTDLYKRETIRQMTGHYIRLLESVVNNPNASVAKLQMLKPEEEKALLKVFTDTFHPVSNDITLVGLLEKQAAKTPEAVALVYNSAVLTFDAFNKKANQLAHYLLRNGVKQDILVPVCLGRSAELLLAMVAVIKAGGAYVPIDPEYPPDRIAYMLRDAGAGLVIAGAAVKNIADSVMVIDIDDQKSNIAKEQTSNPDIGIAQTQTAYVIYTSGSTGNPKGIKVMHKNVVHFLAWADRVFKASTENILASTSVCFDLSVFEIFLPLTTGGQVILVDSVLDCGTNLSVNSVTLINTVPSAIRALLSANAIPRSVKTINLAGEPLQIKLVQELYELDHIESVFNLYGPSETTTYSTFTQVKRDDVFCSIGKPIYNTGIYILDEHFNLLPQGVPGEIYIGGRGVSAGYLHRPELTAERFLPNPFVVNDIIYKTGDIGKWLPDGNILLLGRTDSQVKVKGFRIELGEVEVALQQIPDIDEAVVLAGTTADGSDELCAYITCTLELDITTIKEYLSAAMPAFMIPDRYIRLEVMPLTPNGKIDRKKLPLTEGARLSKTVEYTAPGNDMERGISDIWQQVLGIEHIGVTDNFFDLGGNSGKVIQMVALVNKSFNTNIAVLTAFKYPYIRVFAGQLFSEAYKKEEYIQVLDEAIDSSVDIMQKTFILLSEQKNEN